MAFQRRTRKKIGIGVRGRGQVGVRAFVSAILGALSICACAGIEFLPGAGEPVGGGSHAPPAPPPPPEPPAPARAAIAIDAMTLTASPLLLRATTSEPDVQAIVKPLLSAAVMKQWRAYDDLGGAAIRHYDEVARAKIERDEALRSQEQIAAWPAHVDAATPAMDGGVGDTRSPGDAPALSARGAKARAELVAALTKVSTTAKDDGATAAIVALASIEESSGTSDPKGGADRAIVLYRQVIEKKGGDTALGWIARYRLAALVPSEARALYDALVAAPPNDATRSWMPLLAAKPVHDWAKAATAFHALADAARDDKEKRAARTAWMGAAFDAGDPKQALEAATAILRDAGGALPEEAIVVARDGIDALGGVDRVQIALNPPELITVALEVARAAAERFDSNGAERAVKLVLDRAPGAIEAPVAASILAGTIARRGDTARAEAILANARTAYAARGAWGEKLRASRKDGAPSDDAIDAAVRTLDRPLPHAAQSESEKMDEMRVRLRTLAQACLARTSAIAGDKGATFEITASTYPDRAAEVLARATVGEAAPGGLACIADRGPSFFEYAAASAKGTVVVAR